MHYSIEKFLERANEIASLRESKDEYSREEYLEQIKLAFSSLALREGGVQTLWQEHEHEIARMKEQIKKMQDYIKLLESGQDKMEEMVITTYHELGVLPKSPVYAPIKVVGKRDSVIIDDEEQIPYAYKNERIVVTIDKTKIYADLKEGKHVSGAHLQKGFSLRGLK